MGPSWGVPRHLRLVWETSDLLALLYVMFSCVFCHFPIFASVHYNYILFLFAEVFLMKYHLYCLTMNRFIFCNTLFYVFPYRKSDPIYQDKTFLNFLKRRLSEYNIFFRINKLKNIMHKRKIFLIYVLLVANSVVC